MAKKISDEELLAALMKYGTIKATSAAIGIAPRTIYDRMHEKAFKILYKAARADILRGAVSSLNGKVREAVETIGSIMNDTGNPPALRLQAAGAILANAGKFSARLSEVEAELRPTKEPTLAELLNL